MTAVRIQIYSIGRFVPYLVRCTLHTVCMLSIIRQHQCSAVVVIVIVSESARMWMSIYINLKIFFISWFMNRFAQKLRLICFFLFSLLFYSQQKMNSYIYLSVFGLLVCSVYGRSFYTDDEWVKMTKVPPTKIPHKFGSTVELECIAMGSPPPSIQWVIGDKSVPAVSFHDNFLLNCLSRPVRQLR